MEEIVAELNRLQAEIKEIEAKRDKLQPLIDENQEVLAEKKAKMEGRMKIYRQRLRDIYINGQINYLDVLLGAKDFSDFSSRMFLLQKIISRDLAMMDTIMKETAEIEARQKELDAQMADIEKMRSDLDEKQQKAARKSVLSCFIGLKKKVARLMKIMTAYLPFLRILRVC